jgi:hypothetical protein
VENEELKKQLAKRPVGADWENEDVGQRGNGKKQKLGKVV